MNKKWIPLMAAGMVLASALPAFASEEWDADGLEGPINPIPKITGSVTFSGCSPEKTDLSVRVAPINRVVSGATKTVLTNGSVRISYSVLLPQSQSEANLTVTPSVRPGVCSGGHFSPTSRAVSGAQQNVNFAYALTASHSYQISGRDIENEIDNLLRTAKLRLNNDRTQTSFVELKGIQFRFDIPKAVVDIDCGTFCPDLGDGHFYVRDLNLNRANVDFTGQGYKWNLAFEGSGREIKGYHNKLGDNFMPDFDLSGIRLEVLSRAVVTSAGKLAMVFGSPRLHATVQSTGLCSFKGVDLCDKLFKTDRRVQKAVESSTLKALNSPLIQNGLTFAIGQYLERRGVQGRIVSLNLVNGVYVIGTR